MTTLGIIRQRYSKEVCPRPFSRFTQVVSEIKANEAWCKKALEYNTNQA